MDILTPAQRQVLDIVCASPDPDGAVMADIFEQTTGLHSEDVLAAAETLGQMGALDITFCEDGSSAWDVRWAPVLVDAPMAAAA